jgi:hypothetical protein
MPSGVAHVAGGLPARTPGCGRERSGVVTESISQSDSMKKTEAFGGEGSNSKVAVECSVRL